MNVQQAETELSSPCYYTKTCLELHRAFPQRAIIYFIYFYLWPWRRVRTGTINSTLNMEPLSSWYYIKYHLFYRRHIQVKYAVLTLYTSVFFYNFLLSNYWPMYLASLALHFGQLGWLCRERKLHISVHISDSSHHISVHTIRSVCWRSLESYLLLD